MLNYHKADEGKVWIHKLTGSILSDELYLGIQDSIDNYDQIDKPTNEPKVEETLQFETL